jgi:hypothetical protein
MLRKATSLKGYHLGAIDGAIGHVKEFYFDDQTWHVRYLVADTGRWLPHRKVLISPHALGWIEDSERVLHVQLTREQVEKSPSIDADKPVSRQFEEEYLRYFGWPFYWADPLMWSASMIPPALPKKKDEPGAGESTHNDPHLRSMLEVIGCHVQVRDGEVGHVEDFLIDSDGWAIRDLMIDTRNWLPGKHVLIAPEWVKRISWEESRVYVGLDKETLESFPEYHPEEGVAGDAREQMAEAMSHQPISFMP